MVALRSRRLESLLGTCLEDVKPRHLRALVSGQVAEAFDLDFKAGPYGSGDPARRELAKDVAALANTAGGLIILGIGEDDQGRAATAPGVPVTEGETRRVRQTVASLVCPLPAFDVLPIEDPGTPGHGFLIIAVARGLSAPHAVLVNDGFRYPRRNGATTRYLSEPEVASAYRDRFDAASEQTRRAQGLEALEVLPLRPEDRMGWVVLSLVPDAPGNLLIDQAVLKSAQAELLGTSPTLLPAGLSWTRVHAGRRCLLADDALAADTLPMKLSAILCHDGAGLFAMNAIDSRPLAPPPPKPVPSPYPSRKRALSVFLSRKSARSAFPSQGGGQTDSLRPGSDAEKESGAEASRADHMRPPGTWLHDEQVVNAVLTGLRFLGQHARDRAGAGGGALLRAHVRAHRGRVNLGTGGRAALGSTGTMWRDWSVQQAEFAAPLDTLAVDGPDLVAAAYLLASDLFQTFGLPETLQLTRDGQIRGRHWSKDRIPQLREWATHAGVTITDDDGNEE